MYWHKVNTQVTLQKDGVLLTLTCNVQLHDVDWKKINFKQHCFRERGLIVPAAFCLESCRSLASSVFSPSAFFTMFLSSFAVFWTASFSRISSLRRRLTSMISLRCSSICSSPKFDKVLLKPSSQKSINITYYSFLPRSQFNFLE